MYKEQWIQLADAIILLDGQDEFFYQSVLRLKNSNHTIKDINWVVIDIFGRLSKGFLGM